VELSPDDIQSPIDHLATAPTPTARALAIEVFDAANQPDPLRWYVKKRCLELTGHELPEPRHLRLPS
jgi:hypothetical protein